jgi:hypothetical protein
MVAAPACWVMLQHSVLQLHCTSQGVIRPPLVVLTDLHTLTRFTCARMDFRVVVYFWQLVLGRFRAHCKHAWFHFAPMVSFAHSIHCRIPLAVSYVFRHAVAVWVGCCRCRLKVWCGQYGPRGCETGLINSQLHCINGHFVPLFRSGATAEAVAVDSVSMVLGVCTGLQTEHATVCCPQFAVGAERASSGWCCCAFAGLAILRTDMLPTGFVVPHSGCAVGLF